MTSRGEHIRLEKGSIVKHHYEVVTSVGSGNFSKVYRVVDIQLSRKEQKRRPLAMKVIKKEYSSDAKYEKQMLIALHKNDKNHTARVSKMHECFVFQECPVFIMPIHGPSIRSRRLGVNRGVVTHEKLLEFAYDILETMDFVHFQCHMVHTDLKPENILIADCNVADNSMGDAWVVCDFGSASLWRLDKLDSDLISTRPYRAPEVVLGNKWHYAADMWSVGCILYEVAVGHRLFEIRDDLTHLHMMERRISRLPEAFTKTARYSSKFFNARGEFQSTPDVIRFGKCRLTPIKEMFRDDRDFLHLLEGLFVYDPSRRMTAAEALALPMFNEVRAARQRRTEREAEEAEARRERRRAASAAATTTTGTTTAPPGAKTSTPADSLMSTFNSLADTVNTRLTDRTDRNALESTVEGKRPHHTTHHVTAAAAAAAAAADVDDHDGDSTSAGGATTGTVSRKQSATDAVSDSHGTPSPHTGRSTTETATTTATTSRLSVNASPSKETGKPRSTFGSASPHSTMASSSSGPTTQTKSGKLRARAVSTPAAITKEAPSHRPLVDNHRASTGTALATTTTTVPKLALGKLLAGEAACTTPATTTSTSKALRGVGESGVSRGVRHTNGQSAGRTSTGLRTVSPAERHASGSTEAAAATTTFVSKPTTTSSRTPRKNARGSRRSSAVSVDDATTTSTAALEQAGETVEATAVVPHTPDSATAGASNVPRMARGAVVTRTVTPAVDSSTASSTITVHAIPAAPAAGATTPQRAPSTTPLGYLSPLERGMTAAGITNRTELQADTNSPEQAASSGVEEEDDDGVVSSHRSTTNVDEEGEASEEEASSRPSRATTNPDGSPRATDYRSPVRRRSPVATPTDSTSAQTSPEVTQRTARVAGGKVLSHLFPVTQPAPNLTITTAPQSEGHRTPREVSPAPVTGRGSSPVTTARRAAQPAVPPTSVAGADGYALASTVPIVRAAPSRGNSRSGSLASTIVTSPHLDALTRTLGPSASSTVVSVTTTEGVPPLSATTTSHTPRLRSPQQGSLTPRSSSAAAARTGYGIANNVTSPTVATSLSTPVTAAPSVAMSGASHAGVSPSMKPVISVPTPVERLKSVPPTATADVRGPSAIPVSASRRTVVKPSPATPTTPTTTTATATGSSSRSGIPEHPAPRPVTPPPPPAPSSSQPSAGAPHLPEAVTRSRERSLALGEADRVASSRRASDNSSLSALHPAVDAATPKTLLPSAGGAGVVSLSSSLSLPSASSHPALGVVRQRSSSTQLGAMAGHPGGLESHLALPPSQGPLVYTPRGSRVLTEHGGAGTGGTSSSAHNTSALPAVVPQAPTSPPPPASSHGSARTMMALATPAAPASTTVIGQDGELYTNRYVEHAGESRPTTPRGSGSGRTSVKSLELHNLHRSASTSGGSGGGSTRPPRSSMGAAGGGVGSGSRSPAAPATGSGGKSPRSSSGRLRTASNHSGQAALNASTGSLHLGVARSPRKPVAPGSGHGTASLLASLEGGGGGGVAAMMVRSPRSPRSSSRAANSPRGSTSSKGREKNVSPRRAPLSPRTAPTTAVAMESEMLPMSVSTPTQPNPPAVPAQGPPSRLSQPRRTITVISSKPASSAQLSRYSSAAAVAPTRTSAQRPPPTDLMASTGKLPSSGGLNALYKSTTTGAPSLSASAVTNIAPTSRQNSFLDSTNGSVSADGGEATGGSGGGRYRRDARTLKRIVVSRPSPQSSGASMVSPQELGDDDASSLSPAASMS